MIELEAGWWLAVAAVAPGQIRMVLQFDPTEQLRPEGVKVIRLNTTEGKELADVLAEAIAVATEAVVK